MNGFRNLGLFRMDPRLILAGMTETLVMPDSLYRATIRSCHARHVLSGIHLGLFRMDPRLILAGMTETLVMPVSLYRASIFEFLRMDPR